LLCDIKSRRKQCGTFLFLLENIFFTESKWKNKEEKHVDNFGKSIEYVFDPQSKDLCIFFVSRETLQMIFQYSWPLIDGENNVYLGIIEHESL
jgi:hypothetical protein